jgi:hypothetical protein
VEISDLRPTSEARATTTVAEHQPGSLDPEITFLALFPCGLLIPYYGQYMHSSWIRQSIGRSVVR